MFFAVNSPTRSRISWMQAGHFQMRRSLNKVCMYLTISSSQALNSKTPGVPTSARQDSMTGET